jgi:PAS domain S-box-containing protein
MATDGFGVSSTAGMNFPRGGVFNAAVDAVIVIAHDGFIIDWNPAAERTFGIPHEAALGRELADLIIPEQYREAHRRGLARYRETSEARILDQRLELDGRHADGTVFPVELTVTRMPHAEPPLFVGFVRDRRAAG